MFFKLTVSPYKNTSYNPNASSTGLHRMHDGPMVIYVNTEEIKRVGFNQNTLQYWMEFKSPPVPWSSELLFTYDNNSSIEYKAAMELVNYIEGTETFS